jgi:hypothetical protein
MVLVSIPVAAWAASVPIMIEQLDPLAGALEKAVEPITTVLHTKDGPSTAVPLPAAPPPTIVALKRVVASLAELLPIAIEPFVPGPV